jgi:L-2-hydroxyglutarate oxidase LhgO
MAHSPSRQRVVRSVSQNVFLSKEGVSLWSATSKEPSIPPLDKNISADVCIVGAGIAGMTTAYLLARKRKSVVILDKNQIGSGETALTTAHLSNVIDAGYREIEVLHGAKDAQLVAQSHTAAIAQIDKLNPLSLKKKSLVISNAWMDICFFLMETLKKSSKRSGRQQSVLGCEQEN